MSCFNGSIMQNLFFSIPLTCIYTMLYLIIQILFFSIQYNFGSLPFNSIAYKKKCFKFRINPIVAEAASKKLRGQSYLLMERQLPLVMASNLVDEDELAAIAVQLLRTEKVEWDLSFPSFPDLRGKRLRDYVGPESWFIFDLLEIEPDWLMSPPSTWGENPRFQQFKKIVRAMPGVNDASERACRLASDFKVFLYIKSNLKKNKAVYPATFVACVWAGAVKEC